MSLNFSGPAEILRAAQKDEEFCEQINQQLMAFLLKFKGIKNIIFRFCYRLYHRDK